MREETKAAADAVADHINDLLSQVVRKKVGQAFEELEQAWDRQNRAASAGKPAACPKCKSAYMANGKCYVCDEPQQAQDEQDDAIRDFIDHWAHLLPHSGFRRDAERLFAGKCLVPADQSGSAQAVAVIHSDGYWTHEPGKDPFDRFGPNRNSVRLKVYDHPAVDQAGGAADAVSSVQDEGTREALKVAIHSLKHNADHATYTAERASEADAKLMRTYAKTQSDSAAALSRLASK